jgi:hypothetical protein
MEIQKTFLVILIILIIVILFNIGIYSYSKRRSKQFKFFTRVYRRAQNPWKEEKLKLNELSAKVASYKKEIDKVDEQEIGENPPY